MHVSRERSEKEQNQISAACEHYLTNLRFPLCSSPAAAHGILRHGHLPGFLRGGVAGLPHSAHQDQTEAEEEPGQCLNTLITYWGERWELWETLYYPSLTRVGSNAPVSLTWKHPESRMCVFLTGSRATAADVVCRQKAPVETCIRRRVGISI